MTEEEFAKVRESLEFLPMSTIDPNFKDKCSQLVAAIMNFRKNENIQYLNTRSPENFLTYFDTPGKKATYHDFPENCLHARIAYSTYAMQGNVGKDATALGRKIKKMYLMVG